MQNSAAGGELFRVEVKLQLQFCFETQLHIECKWDVFIIMIVNIVMTINVIMVVNNIIIIVKVIKIVVRVIIIIKVLMIINQEIAVIA